MPRLLPVLLGALLLAGCTAEPGGPVGSAQPSERSSGSTVFTPDGSDDAATLLAALRTAPEDRSRRYDRAVFGYGDGPFDPDGDGCWTRREVLIRDAVGPLRVGRGCRLTGTWRSVYDGRTTTDPDAFSLDHLVPLAEAWRSGADRWSRDRLVAYGNDVGYRWSLVAVTASVNEDKGDQDPATWLPSQGRCTYAGAWVAVKTRWRLAVDARERAALAALLTRCGPVRVAAPGTPDLAALLP